MAATNRNKKPRGFRIPLTPIVSRQNSPNDRINTIPVATILIITVNLRRKTVHLTTPET